MEFLLFNLLLLDYRSWNSWNKWKSIWPYKKLKISKWNFFPIQNGSKHLKFFQKNEFFQKILRTFWFIQKIENFKIKRFCHTKWVKTLKIFLNTKNFQKILRTFWFIQKIENFKNQDILPFKIGQNTYYLIKGVHP